MSQQDSQKRRRRAPPPSRLGWPSLSFASSCSPPDETSTTQTAMSDLQSESMVKNIENISSSRRVTFDQPDAPALWTEKHAPSKSVDLAVAPKKVKEVLAWMQAATSKLLILVGKPGIGKSTMVRVLAKELGLELHEWNEGTSSTYDDLSLTNGAQLLEQQGPMASFEQFLQQLAPGFTSVVASEISPAAMPTPKGCQRAKSKVTGSDDLDRLSSILLLDDLPNLHGTTAELKFRTTMHQFLHYANNVPVIFIYSNVVEGKHRPEDLERLIDKTLLYSPCVSIVQIQPPTSSRLRKALEGIAKRERFGTSSGALDELCLRSGGDLRFAIMTLQYERAGLSSQQMSPCNKRKTHLEGQDEKLSTFHALGKLLYAKRDPKVATSSSSNKIGCSILRRPSLQFIPELVMDQCDMDLGGAIVFLQCHCPPFFEDLTDLAESLNCFSDAAFLLDRPSLCAQSSVDFTFPHSYAGSLAARSVATYNHHPAPGKFRQFNSPKIFEILRKRDVNKLRTHELMHRWHLKDASSRDMSESVGLGINNGTSASYFVDCLPFIRQILPSLTGIALLPTSMTNNSRTEAYLSTDEQEELIILEEQKQVLLMDDIIEFDSDQEAAYQSALQVAPTRKRSSAGSTPSSQRENILN